jgi:hypothetical protein
MNRVRNEKPLQPLGVGWASSRNIALAADLSDVLIVHNYSNPRDLQADIEHIKDWGRAMNKPVIINEFAGRPGQPIEDALPVVAKAGIGWCFWELMIGSTQFTQGRVPYQGHVYPDGGCFSLTEVASILDPENLKDDAERIALNAGFRISERAPKAFVEESIAFSPLWNRWEGRGPAAGRLWHSNRAGETAHMEITASGVELVLKHGPDCGIATVMIDGKPADTAEVDTYAKDVEWNRGIVVARNLPPGRHTVTITVTGRKSADSSNSHIQIVKITGLTGDPAKTK